ncbi:MAG: hypothetical protein JO180_09425 [Gemmatirosa sp.]|nr:hypothetical protein [Gemmatirosa sp.]
MLTVAGVIVLGLVVLCVRLGYLDQVLALLIWILALSVVAGGISIGIYAATHRSNWTAFRITAALLLSLGVAAARAVTRRQRMPRGSRRRLD